MSNGVRTPYTRADAVKIIDAYRSLLEWALEIVRDVPYSASVDAENYPHISISGDEVILFWKEYDSDYYGGGSLEENEARFPVRALAYNPEELRAVREKMKAAERERLKKVRAAEAAVARDRAEQHDRAEFARLSAKYKHGVVWPDGEEVRPQRSATGRVPPGMKVIPE